MTFWNIFFIFQEIVFAKAYFLGEKKKKKSITHVLSTVLIQRIVKINWK